MRYSLRTLIVLLLILPPLGAWGWREYEAWRQRQTIQLPVSQAIIGGPVFSGTTLPLTMPVEEVIPPDSPKDEAGSADIDDGRGR